MTPRVLSRADRRDWLRLIRTPGIGPVTFFEILRNFKGDAQAALACLPALAKRAGRKGSLRPMSAHDADREIAATEALNGRLLAACEPEYPDALAALEPPPPIIIIAGNGQQILKRSCVAIVGSRNASAAGRRIAREMAAGLGAEGITVVSGMARGVDGEAHHSAMETGTIAVLAGGIDHIYPHEHRNLYQNIMTKGAIISESPVGYQAIGRDFPRRNRMITGLCLGVVVVEAGLHSGSLISARTAAEQGRIVMAVPGSPLDPRSCGVNDLLRNGACLVENSDDVLAELDDVTSTRDQRGIRDMTSHDYAAEEVPLETPQDMIDIIAALLSPTPVPIEDIATAAETPIRVAHAAVAELELAGIACTLAGGLVGRVTH